MKHNVEIFVKRYIKAISDNNAAIFAGAGLSVPAGFVNWKGLLKDIADELKLDIDKEKDLIAVAQYYVNEKGGRGAINQKIIEEFTRGVSPTKNLKLLANLPIKYYWTTNYDNLIERSLDEANKSVDIKITQENLATSVPRRDVILYKMHGDISLPHQAILTKDDYEDYNSSRQLYTTALQGDLVTKTFLFIGFSFEDPNLEYILSRIRILLGENKREHFCFLKQSQVEDYLRKGYSPEDAEKQTKYDRLSLEYKVKDLKRYSIDALIVDDYGEITQALELINKKVKRKNIFISGAAHEYGKWSESESNEFVFELSKQLAEKRFKLITGFGLGIGSSVINGALTHIFNTKYQHIDDVILMRPFPQVINKGADLKHLWTEYRKQIAQEAGVAIFMFGNKMKDSLVVESDGMIEEFKLTIANGIVPIPIGVTGFSAKKIWAEINSKPENYGYNTPELRQCLLLLNDDAKPRPDLINNILKIVNLIQ